MYLFLSDHFTKYAKAVPAKNQLAKATTKVLFGNCVCHYSFPERLHSDQGRNCDSKVIKELCEISVISKSRTTPYYPMGNGLVERFNQTLIKMLGTLENYKKEDWKSYVLPLVHAYNANRIQSTLFNAWLASKIGYRCNFKFGQFRRIRKTYQSFELC